MTTETMETARILELEARHGSGLFPQRPVAFVRGEGARLYDAEGRELIDCASGHGVASLGHAHPRIAAAVAEQAGRLITATMGQPNDRRAELYERLARVVPSGLERFFLCNSGTEAVEAALKFARLSTGRTGVVAFTRAFHGRTFGALSATHEPRYRKPFEPLVPGFAHAPYGDLAAARELVDQGTACVIVEVIQGEGGVRPGAREFLLGLRALCDERGALLVVDEVQTGFCRTGRFFACEHFELIPDLLCLGKAIAGGVPMGAVAIGPRVIELPVGAHGSTFGGNPLACAAACAALDVMESEDLAARAAELGLWVSHRLREAQLPVVREVRGLGLMIGVELRQRVAPYLQALFARGVLALPAGVNVLRLLPPLVITRSELERVMDAIESVLGEAGAAQ